MVTNLRNTISQFKRFIGKKFSDPIVQEEIKTFPYEVVERTNDSVGIKVLYRLVSRTCTNVSFFNLQYLCVNYIVFDS